jgi:hypothetical protein
MSKSKTVVKMVRAVETVELFDSVANILETHLPHVIEDWLSRVQRCPELTYIPLNFKERTGYLPLLLHDVIARSRQGVDSETPISVAAGEHGDLRYKRLCSDGG